MAKTKFHKLHKIKIHHNRWLIWTIAYLLFVAIALIGYLKVSDLNIDSENTADSYFSASHNYTDSKLGFALKYPSEWSIEANSDSSVTFLPNDSEDNGVTLSVVATTAESSIRKPLKISSESSITVDSSPAVKIINDLGKGHSETVILAKYKSRLYVIRGSDSYVQKFLLTFRFLNK